MSFIRRHPLATQILGTLGCLIIIAVIIVRIYANGWLLNYVNNVLQHIDGYQGSVQGISIDLYRGAYKIHKLVLNKKEGTIPTPFILIDEADLSIEWSALLHGRIVSDIILTKPTINFAISKNAEQNGETVDWTKPIRDLMPIDINSVKFTQGKITYQDFASKPNVNLYINHMQGDVTNLRNVVNPSEPLPSTLEVRGSSIGNGNLAIKGHLNILKDVPDMDLSMQLENADLTAINSYSDAYAAFDFKSGELNFYSQLKVKNSAVSGYIKLLAQKIAVNIGQSDNPLQAVWKTVVAGVIKLFTNPTKDQFAAKADLDGDLKNINTDTWSAIVSILQNAFISALQKGFDDNGNPELIPAQK